MYKKEFEYIHYARNIYVYMNNILDKEKANRVHSISIGRCFCFLQRETFRRDDIFLPCCEIY